MAAKENIEVQAVFVKLTREDWKRLVQDCTQGEFSENDGWNWLIEHVATSSQRNRDWLIAHTPVALQGDKDGG